MKSLIQALLAGIGLASFGGIAAASDEAATQIDFETALADTENWREADPSDLIYFKIVTSEGKLRGELYIETAAFAAPNHVKRFKEVVKSGDFDGTVFHRVIDDFMAQGGDVKMVKPGAEWENIEQEFVFERQPFSDEDSVPKADLLRKSGFDLPGYINGFPIHSENEYNALSKASGAVESWIVHCPGTVSTARTGDPNSASTQFFLMRETSPHLDKDYTAWGRVVVGLDVVQSIKKGSPSDGGSVNRPDVLVKAQMVEDMAPENRPRILIQKTDGPMFADVLATNQSADVCELPPVPAILK